MGVKTNGFLQVAKRMRAKYGDDCARYSVLRQSQFMENRASENLKTRVYLKSKNKKLTGRANRGFANREYDNGLTRQVVANPQLAGASFNYSKILDTGRKGFSAKNKKVLAVPTKKFGGTYNDYKSKRLPKLSKRGDFVILGRKVGPYKGTRFFQDAIRDTRANASRISKETIKRLWPNK